MRRAVDYINKREYLRALNSLANVENSQRNSRWYYLSAVANYNMGNTVQAIQDIKRACAMSPNNRQYRMLYEYMTRSQQTYRQNARGYDMNSIYNLQQCFTCLCLSNLLCQPFCCICWEVKWILGFFVKEYFNGKNYSMEYYRCTVNIFRENRVDRGN